MVPIQIILVLNQAYLKAYLKALLFLIFIKDLKEILPYVNDPISGNQNLIPTQRSRQLKSYSCKISTPDRLQLTFNGTVVAKVNEAKHFGPILNPGLSFETS